MYIQINKELTTKDGGTIAVGSMLSLGAYFPHDRRQIKISNFLYRTYAGFGSGQSPIKGCLEIRNSDTLTYTEEEQDLLTTTDVYNKMITYLLTTGFAAEDLTLID
jgi:hypothetical protein